MSVVEYSISRDINYRNFNQFLIFSQEMQHRSELERLLAADRDQLVDDVKQLKAERKEKLEEVKWLETFLYIHLVKYWFFDSKFFFIFYQDAIYTWWQDMFSIHIFKCTGRKAAESEHRTRNLAIMSPMRYRSSLVCLLCLVLSEKILRFNVHELISTDS